MKDIRTRSKPIPRFGGGLRAARESLASPTVPSNTIALVAALWASAAVATPPSLFGAIAYILGATDIRPFYLPIQESVLERIAVSFILTPVSIIFSGLFFFFFFGPFMVIVTWMIKLLKLPRGISDTIGWGMASIVFILIYNINNAYSFYYELNNIFLYNAIYSIILVPLFSLGGYVYFYKQRQLHRDAEE